MTGTITPIPSKLSLAVEVVVAVVAAAELGTMGGLAVVAALMPKELIMHSLPERQ